MKKKLSIFIALVMAISLCLTPAVASADPSAPTIDGVIDAGEWGTSLCTETGTDQTVTVYAQATTDALYLAFDTGDVTDNRGEAGLDVLDWNIGLVGSDMTSHPWRYVLVTKVSHDYSWGDSWDVIDGYHGSWGDTWDPGYYSHIPEGIEMVTSFATGHRVTEFKVPMSLMFDGAHGWDGPNAGDVLLLGGSYTGDPGGQDDQLWWPTGINHGIADTYAEVTIPANTDVSLAAEVEEITAINVSPTDIDFGTITPGPPVVKGDDITVENIGQVIVDVSASINPTGGVFQYLLLNDVDHPSSGSWSAGDLGMLDLEPTKNADCTTKLAVPATYSAQGVETAILTFTAQTK